MDIGNLFIRALDRSGNIYYPYEFVGGFTQDERDAIELAIKLHVPERVDSMFNNWRFTKAKSRFFMAKRATWDMVISTNTAQEMAQRVADYYNR